MAWLMVSPSVSRGTAFVVSVGVVRGLAHGPSVQFIARSPHGSAHLEDADHVARGIAERTVANAPRLVGRLLDDLGVPGLQLLEGAVKGPWWPG